MAGVLLRSKARWVVEWEKITKYFCNLEKRNYVSKQMTRLISKEGVESNDVLDINKEVNTFYSNLYKEKELEDYEIEHLITGIPKLSQGESRSFEGKLTIEEAGIALENMENAPVRMDLGQIFVSVF